MNKRQLAEATQLTGDQILSLVERVFGKHRGDPLPSASLEQIVGQFTSAMKTALGDHSGWQLAERVLLAANPLEELELILATRPIKYPGTVRKVRPQGKFEEVKMNDQTTAQDQAPEAEAGARRGRTSKLSGARLYYDAENPRRAGSFRHKAVEIIKANPGITLEEFEAKGGRRQDILFEMKFAPDSIRVEHAEEAEEA